MVSKDLDENITFANIYIQTALFITLERKQQIMSGNKMNLYNNPLMLCLGVMYVYIISLVQNLFVFYCFFKYIISSESEFLTRNRIIF